jgi:uncharacterized cupredoxin-like copper-binding protein
MQLRVLPVSAIVLATICGLFATGGYAASGKSVASDSAGRTTRVYVTAAEWGFILSPKTARVGTVNFVITNGGQLPHDLSIGGKTSQLVQPGQSATLTVIFAKRGHYPYRCTVHGHAAAGMRGIFTVTK